MIDNPWCPMLLIPSSAVWKLIFSSSPVTFANADHPASACASDSVSLLTVFALCHCYRRRLRGAVGAIAPTVKHQRRRRPHRLFASTPHVATLLRSHNCKNSQEVQLSQRDRAMLRVIEYFANYAKSLKVIRNDTFEGGMLSPCLVFHCNCVSVCFVSFLK